MKTKIDKFKELIVNQQLEIQRLKKEVDNLQDSHNKRKEWLAKAKREGGFSQLESFDDVWRKVLEKYKEVTKGDDYEN